MPGNDAFTVLLVHADGVDASTTFTDASTTARALTAVADAQVDTAQFKFGGASALFDGTGDSITAPDHADWVLGTGDFTIDAWVRFAALPGVGVYYNIVEQRADANNWVQFIVINNSGTYRLQFFSTAAGSGTGNFRAVITPSINTWYHMAVERHGANCNFYLDGVKQTTEETTAFGTLGDVAAVMNVGGGSGVMNGWIDELRFSKGVARYAGTGFTPPTAAYNQTFSLTAEVGAFTLTGLAALKGIKMAAAVGSYALTGMAAVLSYGYKLLAAAGSYTLTGYTSTLYKALLRRIGARRGSAPRLFKRRVTDPSLTE